MGCLLLQLVAPAFACQHSSVSDAHQACHQLDNPPGAVDDLNFCAKCFAGLHGGTAVTTFIFEQSFPPPAGDDWTASATAGLTGGPAGRLFKPPISV